MTFYTTSALLLLLAVTPSTMAFSPFFGKANNNNKVATNTDLSSSAAGNDNRPIYDPFNLYGPNSQERKTGRIQPLEDNDSTQQRPVLDPLNLYADKSQVSENVDMSASLPFVPRPSHLTGELPGDVGFDPLGLASSGADSLDFQRRAELKHGRLAMLAAVGWPLSELFQQAWSSTTNGGQQPHLEPSLLNVGDRVPSVLNGGLDKVSPLFWVGALAFGSVIEVFANYYKRQGEEDALLFDPLGLYPSNNDQGQQEFVKTSETFHGRLAMLAIVGYAMQEFATQVGVVNETPFFFHPAFWSS